MPATQKPTKQLRLQRLAQALGCARSPFYVRRPISPGLERMFPVEGWYWTPPAGVDPEFLGASHLDAHYRLRRLLDEKAPGPARLSRTGS